MPDYSVYLEVGPAGAAMAHLLGLPGCVVRADSVDEALAALPGAVAAHHAWLRRHGRPAPEPQDVSFTVAETAAGHGPFDPGDHAALFEPDRAPLTGDELEPLLRLADDARNDLLDLTRHLPDEILDWRPDGETMSVRRILRHVGNSEEWYVSRLVPPDTLPAEWEHDDELPIFDFLAMERRTVAAGLRRLGDAERSQVSIPTAWTERPGEPWTARKALRRLLEHQFEHTGHVRELLAAWRRHLLAHLAGRRAELLSLLVGLDETTLVTEPLFDSQTAKDLLGHVAAWDELFAGRLAMVLAGRADEIASIELDDFNAAVHAARAGWSLSQALDAFTAARAAFLEAFARVSDDDLHRAVALPWGDAVPVRRWAAWRARHDAGHAADLARWREQHKPPPAAGPKSLLLASLRAGRDELCALADLVPAAERQARPLIGEWSLADLLGHVADWEQFAADCLRADALLEMGYEDDDDAWNAAHVAARRHQPWPELWRDFHSVRDELVALVEPLTDAGLAAPTSARWRGLANLYTWVVEYLEHEREHAASLRAALLKYEPVPGEG